MRYIQRMTMQMAPTIFASGYAAAEEAPEFKLVIAYEDFAHGQYAIKFFEWIVAKFGELFTFVPHFLKFEELLWPQVNQQVTRELADASMVVIAANEETDLPLLVKDWLRSWETANISDETALVALLSFCRGKRTVQTPVRSQLKKIARRTGMKFFFKPIGCPPEEARFPGQNASQAARAGR
jgi:hypothetical protein